MDTAVLYARVSTDDKGQTNETQIREMRRYCESRDISILGTYTDEATGRNDLRPGFMELKRRIAVGDVTYVIARNQDRISREPRDYYNFLAICESFNVLVRYTDNDSKPETAEGVIFDAIQSGLAKADNIKRSSATKKGMETARLHGVHCGRYLAFCWSDEVSENAARIQYEGPHKTAISSVDTVMDFARGGLSIPQAQKLTGISHMTLKRALDRRDLLETYNRTRIEAHRRVVEHKGC